ncbi:MAG: AI-2E family transporter [Bacillota bacterium]
MQPFNISYTTVLRRLIVFSVIVIFFKISIFKLTPFFLAFLLVLIMEKPINLLSRYMPRLPAVIIVLSIILIITVTATLLIASNIITELIDLGRYLPQYREQITSGIDDLIQRQKDFFEVIPDEVEVLLRQNINVIYQRSDQILSQFVNRLVNLTFNIPGLLIFIIFTVFASFYISRDKDKIFDAVSSKLNLTEKDKVKLASDFTTYVRVQLLIITNTTLWVGVTLRLIDFPYAWILAITAGILDLIPVIGPGGILWPLIIYHGFIDPVYSILFFFIYVLVISFRPFLEANILATNIGVHPVILLFGLYAGLNLLGIQGIIIAPLSIIAFKALLVADIGL